MTSIKGQSDAARQARLAKCCCPTHGLFMSQVSGWFEPKLEPHFTVVACPRDDCDETYKAQSINGPFAKLSAQDYDMLMAAEARVTFFMRMIGELMDERDAARERAK